jgi:hypothetical protein
LDVLDQSSDRFNDLAVFWGFYCDSKVRCLLWELYMRRFAQLFVLLTIVLTPVYSFADGIDLAPFLTRVGKPLSIPGTMGVIALFMLANYVLNLFVIGLPAIRYGNVSFALVSRGMVSLTILGQLADRVGGILATLAIGLVPIYSLFDEWEWPLVILNFLFSGVAVGALALCYLRRRWGVSGRRGWPIAIAAAVLTNPVWMLFLSAAAWNSK